MKVHQLIAILNYADPHAQVGISVDIPDWEVQAEGPLNSVVFIGYDDSIRPEPTFHAKLIRLTTTEETHQ